MNFMNGLPMNPGFAPGYQNGHGGGGYGGGGGGYGGGGGGGRGRGRRDDRRGGRGRGGHGGHGHGGHERQAPESSSQRFRKMIIRFADEDDFHPIEDPPRLAKVLRRQWREGSQGVCDGFRIGITQEPHKHHHFTTLLLALSLRPTSNGDVKEEEAEVGDKRKAGDDESPDYAREVLEDLSRAFRGWVEGREWLNMRLCFYSSLVPAGLVTPRSLLDLYKSLLAVLSELGGGGDRADRVVRSVAEGLMRCGKILYDSYSDEVLEMVDSIISSIQSRRGGKALYQPLSPILPHGEESESLLDSFDHLLQALQTLRSEEFAPPLLFAPHHADFPVPDDMARPDPFELPTVSMPPELYDSDEDRWQTGEGQIGNLVLFSDEVVPSPSTPLGWVLRSLLLDIVHIFEVNRKESARILLSLSRFIAPGTFKPTASAAASGSAPTDSSSGSTSIISLESSLISTLLNVMFLLPHSPCKLIYYSSVITELCKISPNTVAPPVGRAVRKLYGMMGAEGLDVEIQRRAAEWFAVHLSNFGFQWMWKEWIPDLSLPASHPKRAFIRRVVELEVRLAYHDRILDTLPEAMTSESAAVISAVPPDPVWPYSKSDHPLHTEATELHRLFRSKEPSTSIRSHLLGLPNATSGPDEPLTPEMRLMAVETLLQLGARSFSHFLNATERYLDTLRFLSDDSSSRRIVLDGVANFWRYSSQMRLVTVDKYLQYGILEAVDVVDWVFSEDSGVLRTGDEGDGWTDGDRWEMLRMALDKLVGRVTALRKRVRAVERDDEAARARRAAERLEQGEGVGEAPGDEDIDEDTRIDRSRAARDAQSSLDISSTKLEKVLMATTKHFVASLCPWAFDPTSTSQGLKSFLELLERGDEGWWGVRAKWGWYTEFLRLYAQHLAPLDEVVEKEVLVCLPRHDPGREGEVEVRAESMVRGAWISAVRGTEGE